MKCIQVLGKFDKDSLGLYFCSDDLFSILFPGDRDLLFWNDLTEIEYPWKKLKRKLEIAEPTKIDGIQGTIHLKGSSLVEYFPHRSEVMDDMLQLSRSRDLSPGMFYVQCIDGAANSTCDIYEINEETYNLIFKKGKILTSGEIPPFDDNFWENRVYHKVIDKKIIPSLNGILYLN